MSDSIKQVLFLCTGNYYRSRFAEILFNHLAKEQGLAWAANSCGLRVQADGVVNVGPLSPFAEAGLEMREIAIPEPWRFPRQVTSEYLSAAEIVIAVKEKEHRPLMETLFPEYVDRVEFWNIHDLDAGQPMEALAELEGMVRGLVEKLAAASSGQFRRETI